jgi:hypothetical protein
MFFQPEPPSICPLMNPAEKFPSGLVDAAEGGPSSWIAA